MSKKPSSIELHFNPPLPADDLDMFFAPAAWAARRGAQLGKLYATHDPCESCGHGRLQHKKTAIVDPIIRADDDALSAGACRHGRYSAQEPRIRVGCTCLSWTGTETRLPDWAHSRREEPPEGQPTPRKPECLVCGGPHESPHGWRQMDPRLGPLCPKYGTTE